MSNLSLMFDQYTARSTLLGSKVHARYTVDDIE